MAAAKSKYSFNLKDCFFLPHLKAENKHDMKEEFFQGAGGSKMAPFANWQRKNKSLLK